MIQLFVVAGDGAGASALVVNPYTDQRVSLTALFYNRDLGLPPGPIAPATNSATVALPLGYDSWTATVSQGRLLNPWAPGRPSAALLKFPLPAQMGDPCARVSVGHPTYAPSADIEFQTEVTTPAGVTIIGGYSNSGAYLASLSRTFTLTALDAPAPLRNIIGLGWDHATTVWGLDTSGTWLELELDGRIRATHPTPGTMTGLAVGEDGTVIIYGAGGSFTLTRGSSIAAPTQWASPAPVFQELFVVNKDRAAAITTTITQIFGYDGTSWQKELDLPKEPSCAPRQVAGDGNVLLMVSDCKLYTRDDTTRTWSVKQTDIMGFFSLVAIGSIGGGRYMLTGSAGASSFWTGSKWCPADTGLVPRYLEGIAPSPSNDSAILVGRTEAEATPTNSVAVPVRLFPP
jgi:hypothetical protein